MEQCKKFVHLSGCGSAWLERCVRDAEAGGSNPLTPTIFFAQMGKKTWSRQASLRAPQVRFIYFDAWRAKLASTKCASYGKDDFVSKLQIALKEANETSYWLLLLNKTNIIPNAEYERLENLCKEIRITLIASVNTAKQNIK